MSSDIRAGDYVSPRAYYTMLPENSVWKVLTIHNDSALLVPVTHKELHNTLVPLKDLVHCVNGESMERQANEAALDTQVGGDHYKRFKIQPAEFILQNELTFAEGNVVKYVCRHFFKNGKEDLMKAKHYIDMILEVHYGEDS